ncbi:hypothetical protein EDB83DRAFT_2309600 [Lactarius deliciosus]|nr:hypothetical protein EDB83DRAFT_2309600 [Lactarius deliciosus]
MSATPWRAYLRTPSVLKNPSDETWVTDETSSRRKSTPDDASMRRSIRTSSSVSTRSIPKSKTSYWTSQTSSLIQSPTFGCRLAKHRDGNMLEARDSQFHLRVERNHNIRTPSYASDLTPTALSQMGVAPAPQGTQGMKKGAQGTQNSHRSHRLAQAKREAKLM